jgi:hypothetical protein
MKTTYSYEHLWNMTNSDGLFEHAEFQNPRLDHGYCVDDISRGLVVLSREQERLIEAESVAVIYLRFIKAAQTIDGWSHNRMNISGIWTDSPTLDDCWGRSLWALGSVAARMPIWSESAIAAFERGAKNRSPWLHANCFAALGAAEVLSIKPDNEVAQQTLAVTAAMISSARSKNGWPWPESRLRYANGAIPQVLILAGHLLGNPQWLKNGIDLLDWLVGIETHEGHISVTPVGGWGPGEPRPGFDQQPIEVAALADACQCAFDITNDAKWLRIVELCAQWFDGNNDAQILMTDESHSVGYDGLHQFSRNHNSGAESTLAMLSTFQHVKKIKVHS